MDPYRVWLSEVMLQQTTVAAVTPRFQRFLERWPTVEALASAPDAEVLSEWAGLGYYARARNLIACAQEVVRRGGFPSTEEELLKLPGIGAYTAAAIAAIAFGRRAVVIDSNIERVISRLHAIDVPVSSAKARIRELADALTPHQRAGDFAQAMMDLGATVCRPRAPLCSGCPLNGQCAAFASGDPERFPARPARKRKPVRHGTAWYIERQGCVWLVRRPAKGLLGGMASLPGTDWTDAPAASATAPHARIRHIFTHFALDLAIELRGDPIGDGWWQPISQLGQAGLPTLYCKAVAAVAGRRLAA